MLYQNEQVQEIVDVFFFSKPSFVRTAKREHILMMARYKLCSTYDVAGSLW